MAYKMVTASIALSIVLLAAKAFASTAWIAPGAVWYDTAGNKINAHGGGVVKINGTFYWCGQNANNETPMLYSSTDLLNWVNLGEQDSSVTGMWRPKIALPNGKFWIYGQQDRYVLSLVSSKLVGGYAQSAKVYLPPNSYSYSDTGMFQDPGTGTWYILTSADHNTVQINEIDSSGAVGSRVQAFGKGAYEAPGLFKAGGVYFLIVSAKTGWRANPNKVFWATSLSGSWSGGTDIAPEAENTYGSQNTFELTITGTQQTTYIYMGDSWDSSGGPSSNYVWLPMTVDTSAKTVNLDYYAMWKVDVNTGVVSVPKTTKRYDAENLVISSRSAEPRAYYSFENISGTGSRQWLTFHYTVSDPQAGEAHIFVNDDPVPRNLSDLNSRAGYTKAVPVQLHLNPGAVNTIRFGACGTRDFTATIEAIEIHDEI